MQCLVPMVGTMVLNRPGGESVQPAAPPLGHCSFMLSVRCFSCSLSSSALFPESVSRVFLFWCLREESACGSVRDGSIDRPVSALLCPSDGTGDSGPRLRGYCSAICKMRDWSQLVEFPWAPTTPGLDRMFSSWYL